MFNRKDIMNNPIDCKELMDILNTMNIPEQRKNDKFWLIRNLGIKNSDHPGFQDAMNIIVMMCLSSK